MCPISDTAETPDPSIRMTEVAPFQGPVPVGKARDRRELARSKYVVKCLTWREVGKYVIITVIASNNSTPDNKNHSTVPTVPG